MDYTIEDLKNMQDLLNIRRSLPLCLYHEVPEIDTELGFLSPTLVDVLPGTTVNIK